MDIYPARELPIEGVTSAKLLEKVKAGKKELLNKEDLLKILKSTDAEVVMTIGAGDIGEMVGEITKVLEEK
jgi:UDP-N-acetylmuramate--alanine ligase